MIKVILVDDEKPALRELEFLLSKYSGITVAGMCKDPFEAMENIKLVKPDVVFLDINMPKLTGIDAASRILDSSPDTDIVFVTAYDRYAIEAFELHALDYILKPVESERFEKTIERIIKKRPHGRTVNSQRLVIKCLGGLQMGWEGEESVKWRTEKTKELFVFLLANNGRGISKEELLDRLWDEEDHDKAIKQLYNGIYYIRKTLETHGIDRSHINIDNNYCLKLGKVYYDVARFYELFTGIEGRSREELIELEAIFEGHYLEGEFYLWAESERERLSNIYEQCITRLSESYLKDNQFGKAEELLLKAFKKSPLCERITVLLLELYRDTGRKHNAERHFSIYTKLLRKELGIAPDKKLTDLVKI